MVDPDLIQAGKGYTIMEKIANPGHPGRGLNRLRLLGLKRLSPDKRATPTCVMLQIDGLPYKTFRRALASGKLPFLSRLLRRRHAVAGPWHSMLPTSTAAFQTGLFYGDNSNIPGFFWFDKKRQREVKMNGAEDTSRVEAEVEARVAPYRGLLAGGSSYSALFTGGADYTFLTFARLFSPRYNLIARRGWLLLFCLSQVQLLARVLYYSVIESCLALYDLVRGLCTQKNLYIEFKFLIPRIFSVVVCREIATLAAILDIYRGVGPIYVNYFAYDEHAHHRGPDSRFAAWTLRGIDASIRRIWKAAAKAGRRGIRHYDVFVWSDHGQTPSVPFEALFNILPERHFAALFQTLYDPRPEEDSLANDAAQAGEQSPPGVKVHPAPEYLERQVRRTDFFEAMSPRWLWRLFRLLLRPAVESEPMRQRRPSSATSSRISFVSTGPVAHLCILDRPEPFTYEELQERYPEYMDLIAQHQGIGFTLVRARGGGCRVGYGGQWIELDREDQIKAALPLSLAQILLSRRCDLCRWINMPDCGDLLLFGQRSAGEPVITYSYEHGSHGGPSPQETLPFILVPARIAPDWPEVSPNRLENLLTLQTLHRRLRRAYHQQLVIELERLYVATVDESVTPPEDCRKQA